MEKFPIQDLVDHFDTLPEEEFNRICESDETKNEYLKQFGWTIEELIAHMSELYVPFSEEDDRG